jgi:hypothetical protein
MRNIREALNTARDEHGNLRCRVVRNQVGFDGEHRAAYGLGKGSPDLVGVLRSGRAFCIEVKSASGRVTPEQSAWWRAARSWGVTGGIAHSVAEAMALLDDAEVGV